MWNPDVTSWCVSRGRGLLLFAPLFPPSLFSVSISLFLLLSFSFSTFSSSSSPSLLTDHFRWELTHTFTSISICIGMCVSVSVLCGVCVSVSVPARVSECGVSVCLCLCARVSVSYDRVARNFVAGEISSSLLLSRCHSVSLFRPPVTQLSFSLSLSLFTPPSSSLSLSLFQPFFLSFFIPFLFLKWRTYAEKMQKLKEKLSKMKYRNKEEKKRR